MNILVGGNCGIAQLHKSVMLRTVHYLLICKCNIENILSVSSRDGLFEQAENEFDLVLAHQSERLVELGNNLVFIVDIAAANAGDACLVGFVSAADFRKLFICHFIILSYTSRHTPRQRHRAKVKWAPVNVRFGANRGYFHESTPYELCFY